MKILLANKFNYLKGGADRYFLELAEELGKNGHEAAKFSMADKRNMPDRFERYFVDNIDFNDYKTVDLFRLFFKYLGRLFYSFEAARKFEKLILDFKPDIVHLQNIYNQISPSIIDVAKKHKLPVVMHLHDYKLICPNYKLFTEGSPCYRCKGGKFYNCTIHKCMKDSYWKSLLATLEMYFHHKILKIYDKVDLFIAPSRYMKDICVEFGVPAEKIEVVNNFINPENYRVYAKETAAEKYLLYFGRLSREKGVDLLIEAFRKIKPDMKLKIAGEGAERENYKLQITNYKLEDRVELCGAKYGEELGRIISNATAVAVPSVWPENFPYTVLEAFLYGKPVIAARIGGLEDMVEEGKSGFLFKAGDADGLADKIKKIDDGDLEGMSAYAKNKAAGFLPERHLKEILGIYKRYVE